MNPFCEVCGAFCEADQCGPCQVEAASEARADDRLTELLLKALAVYEQEYPGRLAGMDDHGAQVFRALYAQA